MDFAALDLGSNSFHLLVVREAGNAFTKLASEKRTLGLGRYVKATGRLPREAFEDALKAVESLIRRARQFPGVRLNVVGTSALRDAANGGEFARAVAERTGVEIEIVSGETEARLVYQGARHGLAVPARIAVLDLGGGSVEIAVGDRESCRPLASLPLGFLRVGSARGVGGTLDLDSARERTRVVAGDVLARAREFEPEAWVFSGGTARAFAGASEKLFAVESRRMGAKRVDETAALLTQADSLRLLELGVDPARVPTLGAGAAVLSALVAELQADTIVVSPGGLREGIVLRELSALAAERRRVAVQSQVFATANV